MKGAALVLLAALALVLPAAAAERSRWHYIPKPRPGVAFKELSDAQRALAFGFLGTALSRRGLVKASSIMALDEVLRRRENSALVGFVVFSLRRRLSAHAEFALTESAGELGLALAPQLETNERSMPLTTV